jgi:hypothetical protein
LIRRQGNQMAEIIQFRRVSGEVDEDGEIDLLTAVDAAIRDLRDIMRMWGEEASLKQAEECRKMLERAYNAAL